MLPTILACAPRGTRFASRTGHLPGLPVNVELTDVVGLLVLGLPRAIGADRANKGYVKVPWTLHEQGCIHIARIDDVGLRGALFVGERLMNRLRHRDIRD